VILVVCAVGAELRGFARPGVTVAAVGVGPVDAAIGTLQALSAQPYALTINAGIGGGFAGRAAVGEAVLVTEEHYLELGREDRTDLALPDGVQLAATCPADPSLLATLRDRCPGLRSGAGVTSATITTSDARAAEIAARYRPLTESMEGFAVLRAAGAAGVPVLEVRGISNIVGNRATSGWDFRAGSAAAVRALETVLDIVQETR
jgi:futalosine hydrolase